MVEFNEDFLNEVNKQEQPIIEKKRRGRPPKKQEDIILGEKELADDNKDWYKSFKHVYKVPKSEKIIGENKKEIWRKCYPKWLDNFELCAEINPADLKQTLIMKYKNPETKEEKIQNINCIHTALANISTEDFNAIKEEKGQEKLFIMSSEKKTVENLDVLDKYYAFKMWVKSIHDFQDDAFGVQGEVERFGGLTSYSLSQQLFNFVVKNDPTYLEKYLANMKNYCGYTNEKGEEELSENCLFSRLYGLLNNRDFELTDKQEDKIFNIIKDYPFVVKEIIPSKLADKYMLNSDKYCDLFKNLKPNDNKLLLHLAMNEKAQKCADYETIFDIVEKSKPNKNKDDDENDNDDSDNIPVIKKINKIASALASNITAPKVHPSKFVKLYEYPSFEVRSHLACNKAAEAEFPSLHKELIPCDKRDYNIIKNTPDLANYKEFRLFSNDVEELSLATFLSNKKAPELYNDIYLQTEKEVFSRNDEKSDANNPKVAKKRLLKAIIYENENSQHALNRSKKGNAENTD